MNKRQKEVLQHELDSEKAVMKQLESQYRNALNDINRKIRLLQSDELTQSKIYQIEYQKALKGQIEGILEKLHGDEYSTIQQYLHDSYTDAFVGTAYDLAGQGIPLIMPIDQAAAVRAIQTDSKISEGLYKSLGVDVKDLKKSISAEVTRGIATGLGYSDIARNIANAARAPLSSAKRIARTEGHRIQQASTMDAQKAAKAKGADVLKQWDSTMDGATRPVHRHLDGQIKEIDEPFKMGGKTAMYPGDFGDPAEDCNCRCVSLTRARWGLDEAELDTLKQRAEFFGLDKTEDFADYKKKYLKASDAIKEEKPSTSKKKTEKTVEKSENSSTIESEKTENITVNDKGIHEVAKNGGRHAGIYKDAMKKTEKRLQKSIASHEAEVKLHLDKIANPEKYDSDWGQKTQQQKDGLLKKWKKDAQRNAEQAAIEREVYKERFGEKND